MNQFELIGKIEEIGQLDVTGSGIQVVNVIISVPKRFKNNQADDLVRITAFKDLAANIVKDRKIGTRVLFTGRIQANNYSKNDVTYYSSELIAEAMHYLA